MSQGTLTLQNMLRAIFVILFAAFGIGQAQQYIGDMAEARTALVNLFKTLEEPCPIDPFVTQENSESVKKPISGKIEFRNVCFSYPTRPDQKVFEDLSFTINAGDKVAFVGYSGSGKSTVVQLIERFYDVTSGTILIDDVDIRDYDLVALRKQVAIVMQEPVLFKRTIKENIRYGKLLASDEEVMKAAEAANAAKFLAPEYDNLTIPVSGGEKQRIAVARAMIKDPKILLLDEATSALDETNEAIVQEALEKLMEGKTSITIAHKLKTVERCNCIYVMENGIIIERGNHEELYALGGKYYSLYNSGKQALKKE